MDGSHPVAGDPPATTRRGISRSADREELARPAQRNGAGTNDAEVNAIPMVIPERAT